MDGMGEEVRKERNDMERGMVMEGTDGERLS